MRRYLEEGTEINGQHCDDTRCDRHGETFAAWGNAVQDALDAWIKSGGIGGSGTS